MMNGRLPIAYFGSINYYRKFCRCENVCFEVQEHYIKQTLRNRMYILGPNKILPLTIPVEKPFGSKTAMKDILISYKEDWGKEHLKALETAYSGSPFFEHYVFELYPLYEQKTEKLLDFDLKCHQKITSWLGLEKETRFNSNYELEHDEVDFRNEKELPSNDVDFQYQQVIMKNRKFEGNLSVLDAVFNLGPMARNIIVKV